MLQGVIVDTESLLCDWIEQLVKLLISRSKPITSLE